MKATPMPAGVPPSTSSTITSPMTKRIPPSSRSREPESRCLPSVFGVGVVAMPLHFPASAAE
jgi:hypothetical protein